jgi:hypothetical protein
MGIVILIPIELENKLEVTLIIRLLWGSLFILHLIGNKMYGRNFFRYIIEHGITDNYTSYLKVFLR